MLRGDLGFAEGYINKKWETQNLNNLLKILLINQDINKKEWKPNLFEKLKEKFFFILKKNSVRQAKKILNSIMIWETSFINTGQIIQ